MQTKFIARANWGAMGVAAMLLAGAAQAAGVTGQGTWETTLLGRDIEGHTVDASSESAVFLYDSTLDITWLRDASSNGQTDWNGAKAWARELMVGAYGGWRLPTMTDAVSPNCDFSVVGGVCGFNVLTKSGDPTKYQPGQTVYSEMAHLFYVTLGNKAWLDTSGNPAQPGWGLSNAGTFVNMEPRNYWSGLEWAKAPGTSYFFSFGDGLQTTRSWDDPNYALAVRTGDVAAVPEPQAWAMLLMGLGAVMVAVKRRKC